MQEKAKVVEYYKDKFVRSPSQEYQVPAVIHLISFGTVPRRRIGYSKHLVFERDKHTCQYCGKKVIPNGPSAAPTTATIDHVVPRAKGGKTTYENTVTACVPCNTKKANKSLEQTSFKLQSVPRKPNFTNPLAGRLRHIEPEWENWIAK